MAADGTKLRADGKALVALSPPLYAELAVTTNFSFLRGASHPQEYVARAKALGLTALGIADRNSFAGVLRAHVEARKRGQRLLVGTRLVTRDGFETIAYPSDREAYARLCRLLSTGNRRTEKGSCDFSFEEMLEAALGQIFIAMPPARLTQDFSRRLRDLAGAAPGATYLGTSFRFRGDERRRLGRLAELAREHGAPLVAVQDALYHVPERRPLQDVLTCIREKCTIAEAGFRLEANAERHLKGPGEMARLFAAHPDAIARTMEIVESCNFSLDELVYEYPDEPVPPGKTPQQHLVDLTWRHAAWRYPDGIPDKIARAIEHELALIAELDFARYFLTVHDIVEFARAKGILCQGRGSAANSAVCYCLGITSVDPDKSELLFARFISSARNEPPDIDVDFEHERREEVIQYLYERYGRERAAICATVIHYRPRSAIREVGKALGLTEDITAALSDTVWGSWGSGIPDAHIRQCGLDPGNPAIRQAVDLAHELIGFPRHLSQHVGGFVLSRRRIDDSVPIHNAAMEDRTFLEWDKDDIDAVRMMKVDVLALGMLSCIRRGLDLLKEHYGRAIPTLADLKQDDKAVYDMLSKADSVGVFQVESRAQMSMLPRLRPQKFYDLVIEVAIVRPGPIQGDMVHPYLRRRDSLEPIVFPSPKPPHPPDELVNVLKRTNGVPLFQEQAMQIAIVAAGFSPDEADGLRRAMATFRHTGTIHLYREKFIGGMIARGYERDFAERCFGQIEGFGEYGFPESHAASFALLVYVSAWIKCHYPDVFLAAILNSQPMGFYQPAQLVRDAREHGVEVRPPDINHSQWDCTLEPRPKAEDGRFAVRLGFRQIRGMRRDEIEVLLSLRANAITNLGRLGAAHGISRRTLELLAEADAFGSLGLDRRAALWAVKGLAVQGFDTASPDGDLMRKSKAKGVPLFSAHLGDDLFPEPPVSLKAMPLSQEVTEDYGTIGLSLKAHPCSFLRGRLTALGALTARAHKAPELAQNCRLVVGGLVLIRQRPDTARGVVFMTIEDETGVINIVIWKNVFEKFRRIVMTARFVAVRGRLQRAGEVIHVVAEDFLDLTADLNRLRGPQERTGEAAPVPRALEPPRLHKSRDFH